jgi:hypothetical protein
MRFKTILKQINLMNLLLMGIIAALSVYILPSVFNLKVNYTLPPPKTVAEDQEVKAMPRQMPSIGEYAIIAEQNIFHSERKIPAEKKDDQLLPKPEFVLYGTLITGEAKLAFLEDLKAPYSTAGRGKRQKTLQLGANLSGYILKEIYHDKVIMAKGEEGIEVKLVGKQKVKATEAPFTSPLSVQPPPSGLIREKFKGSGLPPGTIHTGQPPAGVPVPDDRTLSKVKGAFEPFIMKKLGNQQTEKPK